MLSLLIFSTWLVGTIASYLWIRKCNPEFETLEKDCIGQRIVVRDSDGRIPKADSLLISICWPFTLVFSEGGYRVLSSIGRWIVKTLEFVVSKLP